MEDISRVIDTARLPVNIPIHAYLLDHHVEGQAVFPAVKAMQVIGETVKWFRPDTDISVMVRGRFDKFLHVHSAAEPIIAFVDIDTYENGDMGVRLLTKTRSRKSSMIRIKEHVSVVYPAKQPGYADLPSDPLSGLFSAPEGTCIEISQDRIYRDLVPFGPAFHSVQGSLIVSAQGAIARIGTPPSDDAGQSISEVLGSPFPLDGAYHCACVWAQRYAGMVAFPVGFEKRTVWRPTLPGETYICRILPVEGLSDRLVFDLWIADENGVFFENSLGVCMKDVSAGRMKPPRWIVKSES